MQQDYPENVIVTVRLESEGLEADIRLPADGAFRNWLPELTAVLNKYQGTTLYPHKLRVFYNDKELQPNDTLALLDIWDGSVLSLVVR